MSTTTSETTTDAGRTSSVSPAATSPGRKGLLQTEPSLLDRAKGGDRPAIDTMFAQFLPPGETVRESYYLGVLGMWGFGTHSFAAVTDRRAATLRVGLLGAVTYQDGGLEHVNSGVVVQPSRWLLFVGAASWLSLAVLVGFGQPLASSSGWSVTIASGLLVVFGAVLLLPLLVTVHHRFRKCGMVLWVREGVSVYAFADRKLLVRANHLYRTAQALRERRLGAVGGPEAMPRGHRVAEASPVRTDDTEQVQVPAQRPSESTRRSRPRRVASGIAVIAAGIVLIAAGVALPVLTAGGEDDTVTAPASDTVPAPAADTVTPPDAEEPFTYGDDAALDALVDDCHEGDGAACNALYTDSPSGSEYESFGATCGGRFPEGTDCASVELE